MTTTILSAFLGKTSLVLSIILKCKYYFRPILHRKRRHRRVKKLAAPKCHGGDDRFLNWEVRAARSGVCQGGLESDLTKGGVHWSLDKIPVTKVNCEAVMKVNKFSP